MLLSIGPLTFDVTPFNVHEILFDGSSDFARKDVIGAKRPLEAVGEGDETYTIVARLFPERFGGLSSLQLLHNMRKAQAPQLMMGGAGSGRNFGFVVVTEVSVTEQYLNSAGVGQMIDVEITVEACGAPSPQSAFAQIYSLFS